MLFKPLSLVLGLVVVIQSLTISNSHVVHEKRDAPPKTIPNSHVVHEKRHAPPKAWIKRGLVSSRTILPIRIGLKQRDLHRGEEFLLDM
jgi:hypothetical protein